MKKTLITLAALSMVSVASAAWTDINGVTSTATSSKNIDGGDVYTIDAFTLSFYIPEDTFTSGSSDILAYVNGADTNTSKTNRQITFTLTENNGTYTLRAGRSALTMSVPTSSQWQTVYAEFTGLTSGTTYTLTTTSGNTSTPTLKAGDTTINATTGHTNYENQVVFKLNGGDCNVAQFNDAFAVPTVTPDTPTESVPEPTTATLSLLALAGLAARRRRK